MSNYAERYAVLGEHFYQPSRAASHARLADLATETTGTDWNDVIARECYIPQTTQGTLEAVSFDFYATMRREMTDIAPQEATQMKEAMRERGVGDPFLHVLLPDLAPRDKQILIRAGYLEFERDTGVAPQWFWAPETALDTATLVALVDSGYQGVICAPEQIDGVGGEADSRPIVIALPNGAQIIALPFDRPFSSSLAFSNKVNADEYAGGTVIPRISRLPPTMPLIGWTDGETFGHHAKFGDLFLNYLATTSLPNAGIALLGLNDIKNVWRPHDYRPGRLRERTAWSCPHGNLIRWHGACPCDRGYHGGWKTNFSVGLSRLNWQVDKVLDQELGPGWADRLITQFPQAFYYEGSNNNELSLLAAKASALGAQISCGTFFENPGTSGRINMLFARQTIEHLRDAGQTALADQMHRVLVTELKKARDPFSGQTLDVYFADLL